MGRPQASELPCSWSSAPRSIAGLLQAPPEGAKNRLQLALGDSPASSWPVGGECTASAGVSQCHALRFSACEFRGPPGGGGTPFTNLSFLRSLSYCTRL